MAIQQMFLGLGVSNVEYTVSNNEEILLYCRSGNRSGKAKLILEELGYTNIRNIGGIEDASKNLDLKIVTK